jgi:hypothetical protein
MRKLSRNKKYGSAIRFLLFLSIILFFAACKDSGKIKDNEIKLDELCGKVINIHKSRINKFSLCFGADNEKMYNSERDEITKLYQNCLTGIYEISKYISERKTIEYDGKKAYEIIKKTEELLNQNCEEIRKKRKSISLLIQKNLTELQTSFYGKLKEGETCYHDLECSSGLICDGGCPGICKKLKQKGESCQEDKDCDSYLICLNGICVESGEESKPCRDDFHCKGELACINYKCLKIKQEGEACSTPAECEIFCGDNKLCSGLQISKEGEECGILSGDKICDLGLYCKAEKGNITESHQNTSQDQIYMKFICAPRIKEGQKCKENETCDIGLYCSTDEGICKKLKKEGEKCETDYVCDLGLICDREEKICKKPLNTKNRKPKGESCTKDEECQSLNCKSQICCSPFNI